MAEDFLAENNLCGQTLLRLVSRAHAIIAELLRLKDFIPQIFQSDQNKYHEIVLDFRYFKEQDVFDSKINGSDILMELDEELRKNYIEILTRFYLAFESVHKFACDLNRFLHDLDEGIYIQQTLETIILNDEGKQLMCEALYLYGIMLLVIDNHIDGPVRERMLVSYYRYSVQRTHSNSKLDEVCQLLRSTGFLKSQPGKRPQHYPEDYFKRIPIVPIYLDVVIGHLRSDDIYHQIATHPHPDHRSTALAQQAAMLVICLYFIPDILHNQTAKMREIVDKFFPDNWVTSVYMGLIFNLIEVWEPYKAARMALSNSTQAANVKECSIKHCNQLDQLIIQLRQLLKEGVLTEEFLLDNMQKLINLIRQSNVTLRWMLLHTNALTAGAESVKKCRQIRDQVLNDTKYQPVTVFELLLDCAELELNVRETFRTLLTEKRTNWLRCKKECMERLTELADVFSGIKPLTRVDKNESLQLWLREIAQQVEALNYEEGTASGRKMVQLISALEEVQEFHQLDSQLQVKQFLTETRRQLHHMIRTANIREDFLITLQIVSDLSYAWMIIDSYTAHMQTAIRNDPTLVGRLRATFLKLSSALDLPLMRINQARSADLVSVSQYYSTELVSYIRHVLHIIPQSMFALVEQIVQLQTNVIKEMPVRLDKDKLKDYAQLDQRFQIAKLTESVSTFTEGILAMKTTLVGIVRLDPKRLLEEGIRRELVRRMALAMHVSLSFNTKAKNSDLAQKLTGLGETMEGLRKSFEYIQDYVRIQGLRMFQEETARIVGYNVEQECNTFQTNHIQDWQSKFQSTAVPIPRLSSNDPHSATFIGRLAREILRITDPKTTVFVPFTNTWYDNKSQTEVLNFLLFSQLERALSTSGLAGLDTLFAFMITTELTNLFSDLSKEVFRIQDSLEALAELNVITAPTTAILGQPSKTYGVYCARFHKSFQALLDRVLKIGQLQLLRRSCSQQLKSTASFDSGLLWQALETLSLSVVNDVVHRDKSSDSVSTSLLPELTQYLHWSGFYEPFEKIYVATHGLDLPYIPHLLLLFIVSNVHKFTYSKQLSSLVSRRSQDGVDGTPFVIGIATVLRHLGPATTQACCCLLIQFARSHLEFGASNKENLMEIPSETGTTLALIEQWEKCGLISRAFLNSLLNEGERGLELCRLILVSCHQTDLLLGSIRISAWNGIAGPFRLLGFVFLVNQFAAVNSQSVLSKTCPSNSVEGMEYEQITCVLELTAVVCYGFLILALGFHWPNEANTYLLFFCLSNGILAVIAAFKPKEDCDLCRWNGILTLWSLTFGFDMMYRSQIERKYMAEHQFRLCRKQPIYLIIIRTFVVSTVISFAAWNLYRYSPAFQTCFVRASQTAKLDETMISFFWILFFYLRPLAMAIKRTPHIVMTCHRQFQVLKHEKELGINGKLLLYKDHHRRLFYVVTSTVSQIILITWILLTLPYVSQLISLVAGLNSAMRLEEMPSLYTTIFMYIYRSLPLVNCLLLISAFIAYFSLTVKG